MFSKCCNVHGTPYQCLGCGEMVKPNEEFYLDDDTGEVQCVSCFNEWKNFMEFCDLS